jgi:hypothetical protein
VLGCLWAGIGKNYFLEYLGFVLIAIQTRPGTAFSMAYYGTAGFVLLLVGKETEIVPSTWFA